MIRRLTHQRHLVGLSISCLILSRTQYWWEAVFSRRRVSHATIQLNCTFRVRPGPLSYRRGEGGLSCHHFKAQMYALKQHPENGRARGRRKNVCLCGITDGAWKTSDNNTLVRLRVEAYSGSEKRLNSELIVSVPKCPIDEARRAFCDNSPLRFSVSLRRVSMCSCKHTPAMEVKKRAHGMKIWPS